MLVNMQSVHGYALYGKPEVEHCVSIIGSTNTFEHYVSASAKIHGWRKICLFRKFIPHPSE